MDMTTIKDAFMIGYQFTLEHQYLKALAIVIIFFVIAKIFQILAETIIHRLVKHTKTDLDDKILHRTRKPITLLFLIIGIQIGLKSIDNIQNWHEISVKILGSIIVLVIAHILIQILLVFVEDWGRRYAQKTESTEDDQLIEFFIKLIRIIGWVIAIIYLLPLWGIKIGPLLASLGVAGIAVAFALQQSLANVFGGISLMMDKAIKIDDSIVLEDGTAGKVIEIGFRSTKIRSWNNELLIVPNGQLANSRIQNNVLPEPTVRVEIPFSVAYGSDVEKVKKVVIAELKKIEGFIPEPEPIVHFRLLGNSGLEMTAYFWVKAFSMRFAAKDEANTRIYNILAKNKIEIPFPQMDVHVKK